MKIQSMGLSLFTLLFILACDDGTEADKVGVGAQCTTTKDCQNEDLQCLTDFKGGYCGLQDCTGDVDCPDGSKCVAHDNGTNYCFRTCTDKPECNRHRDLENEANCSSNITFVDEPSGEVKACVPPSADVI